MKSSPPGPMESQAFHSVFPWMKKKAPLTGSRDTALTAHSPLGPSYATRLSASRHRLSAEKATVSPLTAAVQQGAPDLWISRLPQELHEGTEGNMVLPPLK
ncbi:hypothetical protein NQZ68_036242 [Dissostichus eleginoides]|nr:hypothetical protein NQZ68_036242 [Dissostichus eleginoides]